MTEWLLKSSDNTIVAFDYKLIGFSSFIANIESCDSFSESINVLVDVIIQ